MQYDILVWYIDDIYCQETFLMCYSILKIEFM